MQATVSYVSKTFVVSGFSVLWLRRNTYRLQCSCRALTYLHVPVLTVSQCSKYEVGFQPYCSAVSWERRCLSVRCVWRVSLSALERSLQSALCSLEAAGWRPDWVRWHCLWREHCSLARGWSLAGVWWQRGWLLTLYLNLDWLIWHLTMDLSFELECGVCLCVVWCLWLELLNINEEILC